MCRSGVSPSIFPLTAQFAMNIAAYCRVSTDKDEQLDSLENQKRFFTEYAQKNGHHLVRLYADEGISGTSLKKRGEFRRLMGDARLGLFQAVVVKDISRFARNTVDFLQSIRELKALGINTMFITANMESLGESEFVLTIFGAMAQEESANLSKRVKFGKKINAQKGRVPQRIFGYDRMDNFTLAINEQEARTVREIFRLYLEGQGCRAISLRLNEANCKTKYLCDWNPRAVRRVLTNPIYCGHYVNHKYEIEDYLTGRQIPLPDKDHFHHDRPDWAIVSPEQFAQAQAQLAERRTRYDSRQPVQGARFSTKHLFSTLIKCEHCGRSFCRKHYTYVNTRIYWKCTTNDQYTAQRCGNTVKLEEEELLDALRRQIGQRDLSQRGCNVVFDNALVAVAGGGGQIGTHHVLQPVGQPVTQGHTPGIGPVALPLSGKLVQGLPGLLPGGKHPAFAHPPTLGVGSAVKIGVEAALAVVIG